MIRISNLDFAYAHAPVLHNINLHIEAGSVTALVGANGAGKTTLMRCIAGLEQPLRGSIGVAGMDVAQAPRSVHRVLGYLSDSFGLYPDLTIARCFEYAAASQGLPEKYIADAIQRTAAQLQLSDRLGQTCAVLSRGLRQRVAIGQAIIHQPQLLLLDEPASGLDPEARSELAILFKQLQAQGMTLLVSSHILSELEAYSTHLLVLRAGQVLENRALAPNTPQPNRSRRLKIMLASDYPDWASLLQKHGLVVQNCESHTAVCGFTGTLEQQAALLAALVQDGLPIVYFAEDKENLEQTYLRSLQTPSVTENKA